MIGQTLGHYRVLEQIGAGGMGLVFLAHDERLAREVALKVLPPGALTDENARNRFRREALALSKLNHPNIATVHDFDTQDGTDFLVMELVPGITLDGKLAAGPLPENEVVRLGMQLAEGLAAAHAENVVHRDLKPGNLRLTPDGRLKILDFGLAKLLEPPSPTAPTDSLSQTHGAVGTLPYMAPEQLRGEAADARSDIWALGLVLYEMASGKRPFKGQTGYELSSAILNQSPSPLPSQVPAALQAVIGRCLEKEPGRRYQRASEVRAVLEAIQSGMAPGAWRFRLARRRWLAFAAAIMVLGAILVVWKTGGPWGRGSSAVPPAPAIRLAVLPFANLTGNPDQEYFSDGLTQEMITQLGRLHPENLTVIARTSVMRYKATDKPIDQIGRELGVDYILEGSARREAGRVRITAELIQVRGQAQLWSESYERELTGILALQSDVARKVAGSLALKLLPAEQARLTGARPVNPEAYEAYLKGLQHWYMLTPGDLDSALQYFELALEKDPNYALAHVGIALVWVGRSQMGWMSPRETTPKAKAAALKALELDDTLAEAHFMLAGVKTWHEWDFAGAEPEFKRAIELNPSYPDARAFYSHYLAILGRPNEAMSQIERALELDPFNALFQSLYAVDSLYVRRYDDAIAQARSALRTAPDSPVALNALWEAFLAKRMYTEALATAKKIYANDSEVQQALERGYAEAGHPGAMRRAADTLAARSRRTYVNPTEIAVLYVKAGDKDRAFAWFERAFEVREPNLPYIGVGNDSLRADPRFQDLLRRMKLPQ